MCVRLARARDTAKDQSYVLVGLTQRELAHLVFPVGELTKTEVRARATAARSAHRRRSPRAWTSASWPGATGSSSSRPGRARVRGSVVDVEGRELGRHDGIARFTVGQRRGLGVAVGERQYVLDVDRRTHVVTVGPPEALLRDDVVLRDLVFTHTRPSPDQRLGVQVRAHGTPVPGVLDGDRVRFVAPAPRVAPGQIVALYDGDELVARRHRSLTDASTAGAAQDDDDGDAALRRLGEQAIGRERRHVDPRRGDGVRGPAAPLGPEQLGGLVDRQHHAAEARAEPEVEHVVARGRRRR